MKRYKVSIAEDALEDLDDIYNYIALNFKAPLTAKRFREALY